MHPSVHAGNSRQGHLTRLPRLSAGAPIDPAGPWCEGPLGALEAGASQPRRPLSAYNVLSAGGSPPPYSIQSHNAAEPGGGNRIGFVCWLVLEKKKNFFFTLRPSRPLSPVSCSFANLLYYLSRCKKHPREITQRKKEIMKGKSKIKQKKNRDSESQLSGSRQEINGFESQYVSCLV